MNLQELKQKIVDGNGEWEPESGFKFKMEKEDSTIHVSCDRPNERGSGFLMEYNNGDFGQFYVQQGFNLRDTGKYIRFCHMLKNILEIENIEISGGIIEKKIEVEVEKKIVDEKQQGMIDAYEKILLGRKVTLES